MGVRRSVAVLLVTAAVGVLFVACGSGSTNRSPPSVAVRSCSMVGSGGLARGYRRRALIYGPLALGNLRTYKAHQPLPGSIRGRHSAYEVIAIVDAGAKPVLTLPRSEWPSVGLLYDPGKFRTDGLYRLVDLDQVVRFHACPNRNFNHGVSQFDGGFVVTRSQCVRFTVTVPNTAIYHGAFPAAATCRKSP
jgi:hypothetical protein